MQLIKLVSPASYKPHKNVINKARHILKSSNMLKNTKKNEAIVNADKMLVSVIYNEN
jgi:hypothetical protein